MSSPPAVPPPACSHVSSLSLSVLTRLRALNESLLDVRRSMSALESLAERRRHVTGLLLPLSDAALRVPSPTTSRTSRTSSRSRRSTPPPAGWSASRQSHSAGGSASDGGEEEEEEEGGHPAESSVRFALPEDGGAGAMGGSGAEVIRPARPQRRTRSSVRFAAEEDGEEEEGVGESGSAAAPPRISRRAPATPALNALPTAVSLAGDSALARRDAFQRSAGAAAPTFRGGVAASSPRAALRFSFVRASRGDAALYEANDDGADSDVPLMVTFVSDEAFGVGEEAAAAAAEVAAAADAAAATPSPRAGPSPSAEDQRFTLRDAETQPEDPAAIAAGIAAWRGGDCPWRTLAEGAQSASPGAPPAPRFEALSLRVVHQAGRTGYEEQPELLPPVGSLLAGRYRVAERLGSAAFSTAYSAVDEVAAEALPVCLKIIKRAYFDQGLDEVKLLRYINAVGDAESAGILRLHDYFYFREHLIIVTELLKDDLYALSRYLRAERQPSYFTRPRLRAVARQVLQVSGWREAERGRFFELRAAQR